MKGWGVFAGLTLLPSTAGAETMLTLHENQAGAICYPAALGETFQVMLPATAGTGYGWTMRSGEGVEQVGEAIIGRPAGGGMVVGGPQMQTLRFRATLPGRHTLTLGYARPFEKGVAPIRTLAFCLRTPAR